MDINLGYKYKLKVTSEQKQLLFNHIFTHNQCWNILLNQSITQFEENIIRKEKDELPKYFSCTEQDDLVKTILRNRELKFNTKVMQQCRVTFNKDLTKTIKTFNKGSKSDNGMLKFKSSRSFHLQGFSTTKEQYKIKDLNDKFKILRLFNQDFKIRWTRDLPSDPTNITISYNHKDFYISFNTIQVTTPKRSKFSKTFHENNGQIKHLSNLDKSKLKSLAMDINIDNLDIGNKKIHKQISMKSIKNDNLNKKLKKKIDRLQRKQSKRVLLSKKKKQKLSKNFHKTQDKINKIYSKNTNKKLFNLHKIVNEIIDICKHTKSNHLIIEKLNIKDMTVKTTKKNKIKILGKEKTKSMKKNILQNSYGMLISILKYKCAINEIYLSEVDPKDTSKTCSNCGNVKTSEEQSLVDRIYHCNECHYEFDRDYNSILNILRLGK